MDAVHETAAADSEITEPHRIGVFRPTIMLISASSMAPQRQSLASRHAACKDPPALMVLLEYQLLNSDSCLLISLTLARQRAVPSWLKASLWSWT